MLGGGEETVAKMVGGGGVFLNTPPPSTAVFSPVGPEMLGRCLASKYPNSLAFLPSAGQCAAGGVGEGSTCAHVPGDGPVSGADLGPLNVIWRLTPLKSQIRRRVVGLLPPISPRTGTRGGRMERESEGLSEEASSSRRPVRSYQA